MNEQQNSQSGFGYEPDADATSTPSTETGGIKAQAKEKVREFASKAKQQTTEKAQERLDVGKGRAADALGHVAESLRLSTQYLNESNQHRTGRYLERAGEQVDRLSSYVQSADLRQMLSETERFARRQPALFLGGAFVLGLLGARFLKSSADDTNDGDDMDASGSNWALRTTDAPYEGARNEGAAWYPPADRERATPVAREMGAPVRDASDVDRLSRSLDDVDYPGDTGPLGARPGPTNPIDR